MGVGEGDVKANGRFGIRVPDSDGTYRAVVLTATLGNGEICQAAASPRRVHRG
jgi:hypothetical protein